MVKIVWYGDGEGSMWIQQDGYEGAWIGDGDKRYKALRPILDLLEPDIADTHIWDEFATYLLTMSEWDAITEGALLP